MILFVKGIIPCTLLLLLKYALRLINYLTYSLNQFVLKQLRFEFKKENKPINDVSKYNELKFDNCEDTNIFV